MSNKNIPFQTIDWTKVSRTEYKVLTGTAYWKTRQFDGLRIRIVEYSEIISLPIGVIKVMSHIA